MDPSDMMPSDPMWAFCPHQPHQPDKPACVACPMSDECPVYPPTEEPPKID